MAKDSRDHHEPPHVHPMRLRRLKRAILGPFARPVAGWALQPPASRTKEVLLSRLVGPGMAAQARPFVRVLDNGLSFGGTTDDLLAQRVFLFGLWEPALTAFLRSRLQPGDVFVDVGANQGWFCLVASPLVGPDGSVVAIEASPALATRLEQQIERNQLTNVRVINEAVAAQEGIVVVDPGPAWHVGLTRVLAADGAADQKATRVRARPLDELLSDHEISRLRVLKMDVEGSEFDAVRGMRRLLSRLPPQAELVIEVGPERAAQPHDVAELFATVRAAGFCPFALPNTYTVSGYLHPGVPAWLPAIDGLPDEETDVVFSRSDVDALAL